MAFLRKEKLGCSVCKAVACLGPNRKFPGMKVKLSQEWTKGSVGPNGHSVPAEKRSLRKKISDHKKSLGHKQPITVTSTQESEQLKAAVVQQQSEQHETTCNIFRTAYIVAQQDRPFTDHPALIDLQRLNGVDVGRILHSNVVCADIIEHIAVEMRQSLIHQIIASKSVFAVLIDESTSLNRSSCLIVYVRATFDVAVGPVTFFLDIVELEATTADGILDGLLASLGKHGLTEDLLHHIPVVIGVDGASVMLGVNGGVVKKLQDKFPQVIGWHCFNHRLELAVHDAVEICSEINHFKIFFATLYALYSQSPKAQRELYECAKEIETEVLRVGRVLDVRWVASSRRSVAAVWKSYAALHAHFSKRACDSSTDSKERAKFLGLRTKLENPVFIKNLGLMLDALEELSDLSLALQRADVTLPVAKRLLMRQLEMFCSQNDRR